MKTSYDIHKLFNAEFNVLFDGAFVVTCGNTTKKFHNPDVEWATRIAGLSETLKRDAGMFEILFGKFDDNVISETFLEFATYVIENERLPSWFQPNKTQGTRVRFVEIAIHSSFVDMLIKIAQRIYVKTTHPDSVMTNLLGDYSTSKLVEKLINHLIVERAKELTIEK